MRMAPHTAIETMVEIGSNPKFWLTPKALPPIANFLSQAALFEFGETRPDQAHVDFALDLYERGLFQLPFPVTAFSFVGAPKRLDFALTGDRPVSAMMVLHSHEGTRAVSAIMFSELVDEFGRARGAVPIGFVSKATFSAAGRGSVHIEEETIPVVSDTMMRAIYGDGGEVGYERMRQRLATNMVHCLGMAVMLMSKGVRTEHLKPSADLNKARVQRGRPAINDAFRIIVDAGDKYSIATESGDENIEGHKRGSPRAHWRRGFFRVLYRGTDAERVTPVAPTLVAATEWADPVKAKTYGIKPGI